MADEIIVEFSSDNVVVYSTHISGDLITIQFYVSLPEGARRPEDAATTHVLPLATLQQVFSDNGDVIKGYTLSSSLLDTISSSDQSKWRDLFFGGGGAVVTVGFVLLCLSFAAYKWKQKKRQVSHEHLVSHELLVSCDHCIHFL